MFTKYPLDKDFEVSGILISLEFCWVNFPFDSVYLSNVFPCRMQELEKQHFKKTKAISQLLSMPSPQSHFRRVVAIIHHVMPFKCQ